MLSASLIRFTKKCEYWSNRKSANLANHKNRIDGMDKKILFSEFWPNPLKVFWETEEA